MANTFVSYWVIITWIISGFNSQFGSDINKIIVKRFCNKFVIRNCHVVDRKFANIGRFISVFTSFYLNLQNKNNLGGEVELNHQFCTLCGSEVKHEEVLIKYYFFKGYEYKAIVASLFKHHGIRLSFRTLKNRLKTYSLQRKSPIVDVQAVRNEIHWQSKKLLKFSLFACGLQPFITSLQHFIPKQQLQ